MFIILLILSCLYICAVLYILLLFFTQRPVANANDKYISVIIAARNEEQRIDDTLNSLSKIKYQEDKFEIIWIDDFSTDRTPAIIQEFVKGKSNWRLIKLSEKSKKLKGKKAALNNAIEKAKGEIILTTDADCIVPESWLSEMTGLFDDDTSMVLGHSVLQEKKGWLSKLLNFDNLFSGIMIAAPTLMGFPISSVGRNLAYKKADLERVGGYTSLSKYDSGDDVHLTELFRKKLNKKIQFNFNRKSFTISKPPNSLGEIANQQIRKNSKLLDKSIGSIGLGLFILIYHLLLIFYPIIFGFTKFWLAVIAAKLLSEFVVLCVSSYKFSEKRIIPYIPLFQLLYPFYVFIMILLGAFKLYSWKR